MSLRWQYADPPPPADGGRSYSSHEVTAAERWAWAGAFRGRRAEFFYDGIEFWHQLRSGERRVVSRFEAPKGGWWHKPDCNCALCQARTRGGGRELAGRQSRGR